MRPALGLLLIAMLGMTPASCLEIHRDPATQDGDVEASESDAAQGGDTAVAVDGEVNADRVCVPDCAGRECGADGCGGSCGTCPAAAPTCSSGQCHDECAPSCSGRECGADGCGGWCGTCPAAAPYCMDGLCKPECIPSCLDKVCGDDGCGGSCGRCPPETPPCEAGPAIAVVFHVALGLGLVGAACSEVDPYEWASDEPEKRVYIVGGVHPEAPLCGADAPDWSCLDAVEVSGIDESLGGWIPNTIPMFDDGTHGDAIAGDGIWTLSLVLPYISTGSTTERPAGVRPGVRLGYKYTYGLPGQGWTSSEEWPGNQRILELEDLNGDSVVTRFDVFGDDAANKDKVNSMPPSRGGCGKVTWELDRPPSCWGDSRENQIDTDEDCVPDVWDDPWPNQPLLSCEERGYE